jgi:CrcB protein
MIRVLYIAIGGAIGALLRYFVSGIAYKFMGTTFPYGTLSVNLIGSFLIGFFFEALKESLVSPDIRMMIFIGIFGAFTTFSSFSLETVNLIRDGEILFAVWNILLNNILGIGLAFLGIMLAKIFIVK